MLLVQDGKMALDDKVSKHLDGTPGTWEAITLRHLLTHTSGLVREAPGFDIYKLQLDIDVIKTAYPIALASAPGEKYEYSNLGYFVLAEVIHRVSGKPWGGISQRTSIQAARNERHPRDQPDGYRPQPRPGLCVEGRPASQRGRLAGCPPKRRVPF